LKRKAIRNTRTPPGTVVHVAGGTEVEIEAMTFRPDAPVTEESFSVIGYQESTLITRIETWRGQDAITWLNINGVGNASLLRAVGSAFGLANLLLEDIQNIDHRPKLEINPDYLFAVVKMLDWHRVERRVLVEQVSLLCIGNMVLTFQERPGDVFDELRDRIRNARGRVTSSPPEYLFYTLVDAVVDAGFIAVDGIQESIEETEAWISEEGKGENGVYSTIHRIRGEVVELRRALWPLRDTIHNALSVNEPTFSEMIRPYWQDVYEHLLSLVDLVDAQREQAGGLIQLHAAVQSNTLNQVMKTLTIIATIFIPLTFVAGIYGMNFQNMPELSWKFGYPLAVGIMAIIGAGMVWIFKRRKWL